MEKLIFLLPFLLLLFSPPLSEDTICYEYTTNMGITAQASKKLNDKACALQDLVNGSGSHDFHVYGRDFYPVLAYTEDNQYQRYEELFEKTKEELNTQAGSYALISKEHLIDGTLHYRAYVKFLTLSPFHILEPSGRDVIRALFLQAIEEQATKDDNSPVKSDQAQIAGLDKLQELFAQVMAGTFVVGGCEEMELAGYDCWEVDEEETFQRTGSTATDGETIGNLTKYDFTGLEVDDGSGSFELLRSSYTADIDENNTVITALQHALIITDVNNTKEELNQAEEKFNNTPEEIITWLHFDGINANGKIESVFVKYGNNLTLEQAEAILDHYFYKTIKLWLPDLDLEMPESTTPPVAAVLKKLEKSLESDCGLSWSWGENCLYNKIGPPEGWIQNTSTAPFAEFGAAIAIGLLDGLLGSIETIYDTGTGIFKRAGGIAKYGLEIGSIAILRGSWWAVFKVGRDSYRKMKELREKIKELRDDFRSLIENGGEKIKKIIKEMTAGIKEWMGGLLDAEKEQGYDIGVLLFDVVLGALSGGTTLGSKFLTRLYEWLEKLAGDTYKAIRSLLGEAEQIAERDNLVEVKKDINGCRIRGKGCFVAGTPVLMAGAIGLTPIPIENIQLFDYALTHTTINSTYGQTASTENTYLGLFDQDPYTSDQQRERDKYSLNETDWYEVTYEEVYGSSYCKLALHKDWITQKGYQLDAVVNMDLPEQGISGPFRITAIKHIIPQKKPVDEEEADDYDYRPVTGIFIHQSDEVWTLTFDNGEELGVTYNHPIYSSTAGDWRLAGELEVGEEVLAIKEKTTLSSREQKKGTFEVYNLEIWQDHNFLVGKLGILVHNSCRISISGLGDINLDVHEDFLDDIQKGADYWEHDFSLANKKISFSNRSSIEGFEWDQGFDFIASSRGEIRIGKGHGYMAGHKNHNTSNPKLKGAGKIFINSNGKIYKVTGRSGHFQPILEQTRRIKEKLDELGVTTSDCVVKSW